MDKTKKRLLTFHVVRIQSKYILYIVTHYCYTKMRITKSVWFQFGSDENLSAVFNSSDSNHLKKKLINYSRWISWSFWTAEFWMLKIWIKSEEKCYEKTHLYESTMWWAQSTTELAMYEKIRKPKTRVNHLLDAILQNCILVWDGHVL